MKKILLTLGSSATMVAPLATVVACGDTTEAPANTEANEQAWDDFTMNYTIDEKTSEAVAVFATTSTEFEINITGFDKDELLVLTSKDVLFGSMHLMNQIIEIVNDNRDKDITGITVNGKRIDDQINNPNRDYYGLTFAEIVDMGMPWYQGIDITASMNTAIGHRNGGDVINPISHSTVTYLDAFWNDFVIALEIQDQIAQIESTSTLEDTGARIEGSKLIVDADHISIEELTGAEYTDAHVASRVAASGSMLNNIFNQLEPSETDAITSIVFETDDVTKEVEFTSIFGEDTLTNYIATNDWDTGSTDYPAVLAVNPTDSVYDSWFNAFKYYEQPTTDDYSVDGWRDSTERSFGYDNKADLLMFKLIMEFHA